VREETPANTPNFTLVRQRPGASAQPDCGITPSAACLATADRSDSGAYHCRGRCLGGGFELALACDLVIGDTTALFACREIKLGVFAPAASALLPVRARQAVASRLLRTGTAIAADEAARYGLAAKVVDDLEVGLNQWLESDFLPRSRASLSYACRARGHDFRSCVRRGPTRTVGRPLLIRLNLNEHSRCREGIRAFFEKRSPHWPKACDRRTGMKWIRRLISAVKSRYRRDAQQKARNGPGGPSRPSCL
jgi:hypothetical protein